MDGTLMDSMWMWRDIDIEYLGRFGKELPKKLQFEIEGMGFTETACYFKEKFQLPQTVEEIKADWNKMAYDIYANRVFLKPGALELLQEMKSRGMKLGIATSNHIDLAMAALVSNQVDGMFDCILTSCDVAKGKPSPDVYLAVAHRLQVEPDVYKRQVLYSGAKRDGASQPSVCAAGRTDSGSLRRTGRKGHRAGSQAGRPGTFGGK